MKKLKAIVHSIMLITTPSLFSYSQNHIPPTPYVINYEYQQNTQEWVRPTTYDEIIQILEDLESDKLERKYSPMQIEQLNEYLATLAKNGTLPNELEEEIVLEEDIEDLIYGGDSAFQLAYSLETNNEYMITPAVFNSYSDHNILQCGKISKTWKKTKKFVKKHKRAIIIGAIVVLATTVIVVAVVAASSASVATAVASAASVAGSGSGFSGSNNSESGKSELKEEPSATVIPNETSSSITDATEAPIMKAAIDEHVYSFKELLVEDKAAQETTISQGFNDLSFSEKARELGAHLAHQAYDEVTELVQVIPQLCEEVKEIGSKFVPESLSLTNDRSSSSPTENYENLITKGHKVIDRVFSTDQAELFTAEAKSNNPMNNFAIGMLPLPGSFNKIFSNATQFKKAGKVLDKAGLTRAGRGLMKHGYREGSMFPKPLGNQTEINRQGQAILEEILNDPNNKVYRLKNGSLKVYSSNGRGAFFKNDKSFRGFIEQQYE